MNSQEPKKPTTSDLKDSKDKDKVQKLLELSDVSLSKNITNNEDNVPEIDLEHSDSFVIHTRKGVISLSSKEIEKIAIMSIKNNGKGLVVLPKKKNISVPFNEVIRVGTNYFVIDKYHNYVRTNKQNIEDDYGRNSSKEVENFLGFKNVPDHNNYVESISGYRNLYKRLTHTPKTGSWKTIDKMLKHLFKGKNYNMILTYFWVLYNKPMHPLPFLGLVGKLKNTGKTTFLEFIKLLFELNAKVIDPEDISANFNSGFIDKLVICIDENLQGREKRKDLQKFKKLITGGTQTRKAKFQDDTDINFYGKFIMASNDIDNVIAIENENTRFWIIEVDVLKEDILDFKSQLEIEIPAFIYYLKNEYKSIEKKSRLWLDPNQFQTDRAKILQRNSRSNIIKELIERLTDYFVENENKNEIKFTTSHFLNAFGKNEWSVNYLALEIKSFFDKESKRLYSDNPFFDKTKYIETGEQNNSSKQGRFFTFTRQEVHELNPNAGLT